MCGFVGYVNQTDIPDDTIEKMADRIRHRGPDDDAYFADEGAAMGFRRLSIIDLAHGRQPMFNSDETKVLTFNGEIYSSTKCAHIMTAMTWVDNERETAVGACRCQHQHTQ